MAISVGGALVVMLIGGQLIVPPIATTVLRHRLAKDGRVLSVQLSAFPWIKLLWQHADTVSVRMADYNPPPQKIQTLLREAAGVGRLDVSIGRVRTGLLTLHQVSFTKHGGEIVGAAQLELRDLQAALPIVRSLTPVRDAGGQLVLRGSASVLGVSASVDLSVQARDGKLVVAPTGLLGALATVTVFEDPQISVQSVSADAVPGGIRFVARGRIR